MRSPMFLALLFTVMLISASFAENITGGDINFKTLKDVFCDLKEGVEDILGPVAFLLVVLAAVIYAGGQLGDAQIRAKAQGWAVGAIVGALIAFVLSQIGPWLIKEMFTGGKDPCI